MQRLLLLDGLRGIAAIGVVLFHCVIAFDALGAFARGYLFVDLFFLLSGFVLTLNYEQRMNAGAVRPGKFLRSRLVRLWPTVAAGVLAGAVAAAITGAEVDALRISLGLLILPILAGAGEIFPLNGPQWSILMELLANLAHALGLRRLSDRWLLAFVAAAGLALCATTIVNGSNSIGPFSFNWWMALPRVAFSYGLGIWIARRWVTGAHRPLVSWRMALILPVGAVILLQTLPLSIAAGDLAVTLVIFPALFWLAATAKPSVSAEPWLEQLGALSFPLYAIHLPAIHVAAHFSRSPAMMALTIAAALAAARLLAMLLTPAAARRFALAAVPT